MSSITQASLGLAVSSAWIASSAFVDAYLLKKIFEVSNIAVKKVLNSNQPEQFVMNLINKAPSLLQRSIQVLNWKSAGAAAAVMAVSAYFFGSKIEEVCKKAPKPIQFLMDLTTYPLLYPIALGVTLIRGE